MNLRVHNPDRTMQNHTPALSLDPTPISLLRASSYTNQIPSPQQTLLFAHLSKVPEGNAINQSVYTTNQPTNQRHEGGIQNTTTTTTLNALAHKPPPTQP